jgi:hypothetical protein
MIPANRLDELKTLLAEDGITVTDADVLEIGLWLLSRIRPVLTVVPLDKVAEFDTIKGEMETIRNPAFREPFLNSDEKSLKKQTKPHAIDVPH